jgi:hypothetical protein
MPIRRSIAAIAAAATLIGSAVLAAAQTPAQDAHAGPRIELSPAQRQTIYQSVSKTQKNHAAPTGFRVSVGGTVPSAISLAPMPGTLEILMPQIGAYEVALIERQVVLVDPQTRQVAAVIREEEP